MQKWKLPVYLKFLAYKVPKRCSVKSHDWGRFVQIGSVLSVHYLRGKIISTLTLLRLLTELCEIRCKWSAHNYVGLCTFRENQHKEYRTFLLGITNVTFKRVPWHRTTFWQQGMPWWIVSTASLAPAIL
jgi:hypothetical protein